MLTPDRASVPVLVVLLAAAGAAHALSLPLAVEPADSPLATAVQATHDATAARGLLGKAEAIPASSSPSQAVLALLAGHGHAPTPTEAAAARALDALDPQVAAALTTTVDAFAHLEHVAADAFTPGAIDAAAVVTARAHLLDAFVGLEGALASADGATPPPLVFAHIIGIDLEGKDTWWYPDLHLLIDAGGNDTYWNNAGGTDVGFAACYPDSTDVRIAALFDVGGNDQYLRARGCGAMGGAIGGVGVLVDAIGDDVYAGGCCATNGGAWAGVGLLIDAVGNDRYDGSSAGVNGGVFTYGVGMLIDGGGDDAYTAYAHGVNGGVSGRGVGLLLDLGGHDVYSERDASGEDFSALPKGTAGAQIDSDDGPPEAS